MAGLITVPSTVVTGAARNRTFIMSSGKRRNPLGLSLPPTVTEQSEKDDSKEDEVHFDFMLTLNVFLALSQIFGRSYRV